MAEFFRFLIETNLITAAFIIGAIAFIIAVIGKFKTIIEPSPAMRLVLALFGLFLMALSVSGYFFGSQATPRAEEISVQEPGSVTAVSPASGVVATAVQPTATVQQVTQQSPTSPPTVSPTECTPPEGLIPLWVNIEPPWSKGIWGSPNMPNFMIDLGVIDTDNPNFGEFQIWIDPCSVDWHDYTDGGRFWPHQPGVGATAPPIPLGGETATTVTVPPNTGRWGLGPRY